MATSQRDITHEMALSALDDLESIVTHNPNAVPAAIEWTRRKARIVRGQLTRVRNLPTTAPDAYTAADRANFSLYDVEMLDIYHGGLERHVEEFGDSGVSAEMAGLRAVRTELLRRYRKGVD